ncbi:MAG: GNAT family N-acetyltransferase [Acutalibacteraceae bacterium]
MIIERISSKNFSMKSLDDYSPVQEVKKVYKYMDDKFVTVNTEFTIEWDSKIKQRIADKLLDPNCISFGAFDEGRLRGFVIIENRLRNERCVMTEINVDSRFRRSGIGSALFNIAKTKAKVMGANQLYVSASPVVTTVDFFRSMECEPTTEIINSIAMEESTNIQMTCYL